MNISKNKVVAIDYTLKNDSGLTLDSTEKRDPLEFLFGMGYIIPGLENALDGKKAGDSFSVSIKPEEAYGNYDEKLIFNVPKSNFSSDTPLTIGMQVQGQTEFGVQIFTIKAINNEEITLDGNHPLAGQILHFDVSVKNVREATEEELKENTHHHGCDHNHENCDHNHDE